MIAPQETLRYKRLKTNELKKGNFNVRLDQFKETLNPDDVDLLIEKYEDVLMAGIVREMKFKEEN